MVKVGERLGGRKEMGADEGEVTEVPATRGGRGKVRLVDLSAPLAVKGRSSITPLNHS
jgi:hypothetical protein